MIMGLPAQPGAGCQLGGGWRCWAAGREQGMGECIHLPQAPHGAGSIDPMGRAGQTLPGAAAPLFLWDVPCKGPQSSIKAAFPKALWMGLVGSSVSFAGCCWDPAWPWLCRGLRPRCDSAEAPDSFGAVQLTPYSRGLHSEISLPFSFYFFPGCSAGRGSPQPLSALPSAEG